MVGLVLALLLLAGWGVWFTIGRITLYETAPATRVSSAGEVLVEFPLEKQPLFKIGQYGWIHVAKPEGEGAADLPAVLMDMRRDATNGVVELRLFALDDPTEPVLEAGLPAQVEIATGHLSPAELIMRASKQANSTPNLPLSPQQLFQDLKRQ